MSVCVARPGLEKQIQNILETSLEAMGYRLVRVRYQFVPPPPASKKDRRLKRGMQQPSGQLQLMFERTDDAAFVVKDCSRAHRHSSSLLDIADPIDHAFQLEVSSAGVLRPLTRDEDFKKFVGHKIELSLTQLLDDRRRFKGLLAQSDDTKIIVHQDKTDSIEIPLGLISEARLLMSDKCEEKIQNIDNTEI